MTFFDENLPLGGDKWLFFDENFPFKGYDSIFFDENFPFRGVWRHFFDEKDLSKGGEILISIFQRQIYDAKICLFIQSAKYSSKILLKNTDGSPIAPVRRAASISVFFLSDYYFLSP